MALRDAEIALTVEQHAANLSAFVSWNAKHFAGKLSLPAVTPHEWPHRRTGRAERVSNSGG